MCGVWWCCWKTVLLVLALLLLVPVLLLVLLMVLLLMLLSLVLGLVSHALAVVCRPGTASAYCTHLKEILPDRLVALWSPDVPRLRRNPTGGVWWCCWKIVLLVLLLLMLVPPLAVACSS